MLGRSRTLSRRVALATVYVGTLGKHVVVSICFFIELKSLLDISVAYTYRSTLNYSEIQLGFAYVPGR